MTVPADRTYPKAAKNSEWQKKKSLGDKADPRTKSTGLGPKLEVAETRWSQIRWHQLDGSGLPADNLAEARQKLKLAVAARGAAQQVTYVLQQAGDKARTTAALTALSKPARTWASAAVTALAAASSRLNTITVQEYEDEVTRLEQLAAQRQADEQEARSKLKSVSVNRNGSELFTAAKGTRVTDDTLEVPGPITWAVPPAARTDLVGKKVKVFADYVNEDWGKFQNDMKITAITGSKVTLKNN